MQGVYCCVIVLIRRSIKKNIADLSQKMSELASRPNGDMQLMDQLSDELQSQHAQLAETK